MKKLVLVSVCAALAGCASSEVTSNVVASEAEVEKYETAVATPLDPVLSLPEEEVVPPVVGKQTIVLSQPDEPGAPAVVVEQTNTTETVQVIAPETPVVTAEATTQQATAQYSIQVVAVSEESDVEAFVSELPSGSVFVNRKMVNGLPWFTLLYGEYNSQAEAQSAISSLPASIQRNGPFVRNLGTGANAAEVRRVR
uniref:SPOR domain-containing protein n=1 Tax=Thaumasiovibrio occultus TaxID=1891184 RepID=UPI000B3564F2|nr:SPOR domain-containing protein [Thaumasiovibrio occultus]